MLNKVYNVLFICTGNSARSIIAEAVLNEFGKGRFKAFSAGSHPTGRVNPNALEVLSKNKVNIEGLRSKSWDEFAGPDAPHMDLVFTVCNNAAGETCPVWSGHPMQAHWGVDDPATVSGDDQAITKAFNNTLTILKRRIDLLTMLPMEKIDDLALKNSITEIGKTI